MEVGGYLTRIGFAGEARADLETLRALCRAHGRAVPFETLDVILRRPVTIDPEDAYRKIVGDRRGGWCYELNGLFGWALEQLGFDVRRVAGAVRRDALGDAQLATHLCLIVTLAGESHLVDVGFGSQLVDPLPLRATDRRDEPFAVGVTPADNGYWRYHERFGDEERFTYDFRAEPADEAQLVACSERQQFSPESHFVHTLTAQRRVGDAHVALRNRTVTWLDRTGPRVAELTSAGELVDTLSTTFGLDVPEAAALWSRLG